MAGNARDATVVADVHSLSFTWAATSRADVLVGVLADLEKAFVATELAINDPYRLTAGP